MSRRPDHVARALSEPVELSEYDPEWPALFEAEADALHAILPPESTGRIEHIGSTAVPGLAAKPIIDILIETPSLQRVQEEIAPILTARGYEFFWRPGPDALAWFIKRDEAGARTHHIHFMTPGRGFQDRISFRDHLRTNPAAASAYAELKRKAAAAHGNDRRAYAAAKTDFIRKALRDAGKCGP